MPITDITEAHDKLLAVFKTAWDTLDDPPLVIYPDDGQDLPDDGPYARVTVQHNLQSQVTVGGKLSNGGPGQRFRAFGIITVQIFTISGDGLTTAHTLSTLVKNAFQGKNTGSDEIEFRNARINEIGQDGPWHQINVLAEFNYDEIS
jgi:hypothetical protein